MGKLQLQVCLISARGLRRTPSFWKLQWYAVAWIDPADKYCTKIDASGSGNPVWKTRFSAAIDPSEENRSELVLHVEVYSREPVFLRQSLFGSATVVLTEFLEKYGSESKAVEEVGSFQLRKGKSEKAVGFVDVSIRVSEDRDEPGPSDLGPDEGFELQSAPAAPHPMRFPPEYPHHLATGAGSYRPPPLPPGPPPPPPPPPAAANAGYGSYFGPAPPGSYISMPASVAPTGRGARPGVGFGMGVAAGGALAAGAAIYGGDLMPGFQVPGASLDASFSVSTYPPF